MAKVGGEVDSFCTKCNLLLAHTVIAMMGAVPVKVECNTCHGVHRYKGGTPAPKRPAPGNGTRSRARAGVTQSFDEMLAGHAAPPRRYAATAVFAGGDVVDHPAFGRGFVSAVRDAGKVEVTFRTGVKVLVHGKH